MKSFQILVIAGSIAGCTTAAPPGQDEIQPIVSRSAEGWDLKPGHPESNSAFPTTIVVNPEGKEFNIGTTQYPDFLPATLWMVKVKELDARFLVIRVPPAASAAVGMPVLYVDQNDTPTVAGVILQRFEFGVFAKDGPGYDPKVSWHGEDRLLDLLFEDVDHDGIPELVEENFWKETGIKTYFRFNKDKTFSPVWREEWNCTNEEADVLVSRTRVDGRPDDPNVKIPAPPNS